MNQPEDWEYEIQDSKRLDPERIEPKQIESVVNPHIEDEYSFHDTGAYRGKPWSRAPRAIGLLLIGLTFNVLVPTIASLDWTAQIVSRSTFADELLFGLALVSLGGVLCQYSAVWLWIQFHLSGSLSRFLLEALLVCAVTLSATLPYQVVFFFDGGFLAPLNPWAALVRTSILFLLVASFFYWIHCNLLGLLLARTDLRVALGLRSERQYSIRKLLSVMMVVAIASLLMKYLVVSGVTPNTRELGTWLFWTLWTALSTGVLTYVHFASRFALDSIAFGKFWWGLVIIGPLAYAGIGVAVSRLIVSSPPIPAFAGIPFIYLVELGFVLGTWIYLRLIPWKQRDHIYGQT